MARWRADFLAMSLEKQMLAATMAWMYGGGRDSIWLRRVPCMAAARRAVSRLVKNDGIQPQGAEFPEGSAFLN